MEYINLYDKKGNLLKEKEIRGKVTDKLVGIAIIFIENSKGQFLIQKTSQSRNNIYAKSILNNSINYDIVKKIKCRE